MSTGERLVDVLLRAGGVRVTAKVERHDRDIIARGQEGVAGVPGVEADLHYPANSRILSQQAPEPVALRAAKESLYLKSAQP